MVVRGSPKNIPSERLESLGTIFGNFIFGRIAPFLDPKNGMDDAPEFTLHVLGPDLGSSHDSRKDGQGIFKYKKKMTKVLCIDHKCFPYLDSNNYSTSILAVGNQSFGQKY